MQEAAPAGGAGGPDTSPEAAGTPGTGTGPPAEAPTAPIVSPGAPWPPGAPGRPGTAAWPGRAAPAETHRRAYA